MTGRYRLVESIGQGGMGRVWRAADEILDRQVAVKEMRIDGLDAEDSGTRRERTLREARATARIDHPNVVRVYDVVDEGERLWIVMELVAGRSLERILAEEGPLDPGDTARIGLGLVAALRQVHARGVLHRDIKPGNVLVETGSGPAGPARGTAARRVVLTDFGIAAIQDAKALTMVGMLVGSPDYMAPERISGRPQGPPSDVWSLGATLCAALGGRSPFARDTTLATLHAVLYEEPELPATSGPLRDILTSLLEKEPSVRPRLEELEAALAPVAFPAPTPTVAVGPVRERLERTTGLPEPEPEPVPEPEQPDSEPSGVEPVSDSVPAQDPAARPERRPGPEPEPPEPPEPDEHSAPEPDLRTPASPPLPPPGRPTPKDPRQPAPTRTPTRTPTAKPQPNKAGSPPATATTTPHPTTTRARPSPVSLTRAQAATECGPRPTPAPIPTPTAMPPGELPGPATPAAARPRAGHRRTMLAAAAATVATVGAVVGIVLATSSGSPGDDTPRAGSSASASPTTDGEPSPTVEGTSRPQSLPPGAHREAGGFAWATPDGWRRDVKTGAEVHYTSPDGTQELVGKSSLARGDLLETWQTSERNAHQGEDYRKVRLEETTFRGHPAVVWEYTFTLKGVHWHARLLGFNVDGKSYQINTWYDSGIEPQALRTYERVKDSFTVL
ncbi:serine/threonine-protein kinase [Streptomyces sp. HP-A2021]|uniref:serine/threonine-protein kinase n=1 Tax=Streptomyces sp. HP-A2021 TaxID=2927875 RepID=UPI002434DF4A|nr:serine/threonine-protein kinase [Streptomyces sp. HP-A2021]